MSNTNQNEFEWAKEATSIDKPGIYLLGFPFDGTACFRKGTKFGPDAIRNISYGIETYSPYLNDDLENYSNIYDLGNLDCVSKENVEENWQQATDAFFELTKDTDLTNKNVKLITLGGEHSISYGPIKKYLEQFDDLVLIHLDAHADLRDGYLGYHYSHASIIKRSIDHFGANHKLIQYGIRSGTKEEYDWMKSNETLCESREEFINKVNQIESSRPIYLTLDLDYFDPSFFPGTGTPEPGGEDFHSFVKLVKILKNKNFVGCDVVELSPPIDQTGNSSVFAAKIVRELLLCLNGDM